MASESIIGVMLVRLFELVLVPGRLLLKEKEPVELVRSRGSGRERKDEEVEEELADVVGVTEVTGHIIDSKDIVGGRKGKKVKG